MACRHADFGIFLSYSHGLTNFVTFTGLGAVFTIQKKKSIHFRLIGFKVYGVSKSYSTNFLIRMFVLVFQRNVSVMSRSDAALIFLMVNLFRLSTMIEWQLYKTCHFHDI